MYSVSENPETLEQKCYAVEEVKQLLGAEVSLKLTLDALKESITAHKPSDALKYQYIVLHDTYLVVDTEVMDAVDNEPAQSIQVTLQQALYEDRN